MKVVLTRVKAAFGVKETGHHEMWCPVFWQGQKDTNPFFGGFALLDDQNLVDFGTRLRTLHLKNSPLKIHPQCGGNVGKADKGGRGREPIFLTVQAHFGFKSFNNSKWK